MSHPFDATLKEIIGQSATDFTPVLHLPVHLPARTLDVDLSTVSAATDVAFGFGEPLQEIVDVNFQSGPDAYVDARLHLCEKAAGNASLVEPCRLVQQREWELLFDHCYQEAIG